MTANWCPPLPIPVENSPFHVYGIGPEKRPSLTTTQKIAADNKLELVLQVDAAGANASIKSINTSLSDLEKTAVSSAKGASKGLGMPRHKVSPLGIELMVQGNGGE